MLATACLPHPPQAALKLCTLSALTLCWAAAGLSSPAPTCHPAAPRACCSALPVPGGNPVLHFLRCLRSMFTESVNADVYGALRRLFLDRMDLDQDFDFHG